MQDQSGNTLVSNTSPHLWEPKPKSPTTATVTSGWSTPSTPAIQGQQTQKSYRLQISVLKDGEFQGDAPTRVYTFPSLHHLTHATNALDTAFGTPGSGVEIHKAGVEAPVSNVDIGHDIEGHLEDVRITYTSTEEEDENGKLREGEGWKHFLGRLNSLEDLWGLEKGRM